MTEPRLSRQDLGARWRGGGVTDAGRGQEATAIHAGRREERRQACRPVMKLSNGQECLLRVAPHVRAAVRAKHRAKEREPQLGQQPARREESPNVHSNNPTLSCNG